MEIITVSGYIESIDDLWKAINSNIERCKAFNTETLLLRYDCKFIVGDKNYYTMNKYLNIVITRKNIANSIVEHSGKFPLYISNGEYCVMLVYESGSRVSILNKIKKNFDMFIDFDSAFPINKATYKYERYTAERSKIETWQCSVDTRSGIMSTIKKYNIKLIGVIRNVDSNSYRICNYT